MLCNNFILVVSRGWAVMALGLVDWVAKVFSSRGLLVTKLFKFNTPRPQILFSAKKFQAGALALWACEEGWMQVFVCVCVGKGVGGLLRCFFGGSSLVRWVIGDRAQQQERLKRRCTYGR